MDGSTEPTLAHNVKVAVKGTLWTLSRSAEGLPIPGAKAVFDVISKVIEIVETTRATQIGFKVHEERCQELMDTVLQPLQSKNVSEIPLALRDSLDDLASNLTGVLSKIEERISLGILDRAFHHEENTAIIKDVNEQIQHFLDLYTANIGTWTAIMLHQVHHMQVLLQLKQHLHQVNAGYDDISSQDRSSCFTGTREALLNEVIAWINDPNIDKPIYVLYGIAGIGKTTVAQTVAEYATSKKPLGASFFFSRAEEDRKTGDYFFSTLASQLAQYDAQLADQIASALSSVPGAPLKALAHQMRLLIVEPIQKAKLPQTPVIMVIDAFDECLPSHARIILQQLANNIQYIPNFKIFITTRPESHIERVLATGSHYLLQPFHLHEIEKSIAKGDIELYLRHALSQGQVVKTLQLVKWEASEEDLAFLADKCGIMFIMASTAVKYILDEALNDPSQQINQLLKGLDVKEGDKGVMSSLDKMYLGILRSSVPDRKHDLYLERFQVVVGAIVVLEDLLPMGSLANLLSMEELHVRTTLQGLHSILAPGSGNQAPQLYHKSFPDFITDKDRCTDGNFYIVPEAHHAQMAQFCFNIMGTLHTNMPNLEGLQKYISNKDMGENRTKNITNELKYACIHWVTHLNKAGNNNSGMLWELLYSFAFRHLLHWIEVLSLIDHLDVACQAMKLAQKVLANWNMNKSPELKEILNDGWLCVTKFYDIIKGSAGHIYYSALPFTPSESELYKAYNLTVTDSIIVIKGQDKMWNPLLAIFEHSASAFYYIAFSSDGSRLASGSSDMTIKLWDVLTGAHVATLEGHSQRIRCIIFSSDDSRLASGSHDKTIRLWHGLTGAHIVTLEGHSDIVSCVAFSSDGSRLASGSYDTTVRLWDGLTGAHITTLKGHSTTVSHIAFSSDGSRIASGSSNMNDMTVRLWDVLTGACVSIVLGDTYTVKYAAFSLGLTSSSWDKGIRIVDGLTGTHTVSVQGHLGSAHKVAFVPKSRGSILRQTVSYDKSVLRWNKDKGVYMAILEDYTHGITTIAFSCDGSRLASGSHNMTVELWNGFTGDHIATLEGHTETILYIIFSSDGSRLASGSHDMTVRLWNGFTGAYIAALEGHSECVSDLVFSSDGSRLASGSHDMTVRLWNGFTGAHIATLEGHTRYISHIIFSSDGSRLASASPHTVKLWDGSTGAYIATLDGHSEHIGCIAFSSDGSRLVVSGLHDRVLRLWDGLTGFHIAVLEGHSDGIREVTFSADDSRFISRDWKKNTKHWNPLTGGQFFNLNPLDFKADQYEFSINAITTLKDHIPVFWFPPEFGEIHTKVNKMVHGNQVAIGLGNGQIILLDLSQVNL